MKLGESPFAVRLCMKQLHGSMSDRSIREAKLVRYHKGLPLCTVMASLWTAAIMMGQAFTLAV